MHHIRRYRIFTLVAGPPSERVASVQIPPHRAAGGVTLLETFVMVASLRLVAARRVFEFGTFFGSTTLNLALNVPEEGEVFTLDLDEDQAVIAKQHPADVNFTRTHLASQNLLDFLGSSVSSKITTLHGNSTNFDFSPWKDSIDFVFIDGGHDFATVRSDTESALQMVRKDVPSCILWHDYRNLEYCDLTGYLDDFSHRMDVFHVEDTMLCLWFNDPAVSIRYCLSSKE
jgi:precorrin-6B methylase 2